MAQHIMLPKLINHAPLSFFDDPGDLQDILILISKFEALDIDSFNHTHKSVTMSSPQSIYDPMSLFAEHIRFLTSFNPDFHLDNSYLDVHHPERVEGLFNRRFAQLPIVGENSPLNMDPLNWRYMYRPNRPFHYITNRNLRRTIAKLPPRPWLERKRQQPSNYLIQQREFFAAVPPPLPEEEDEPAEDRRTPGPLKVWVQSAWTAFLTIAWMVMVVVILCWAGLRWMVERGLGMYQKVGGFPWEAIWFALAASQLLKFLPGMEGEAEVVNEALKGDPPLYVVMIRNPNQWSKFNLFCIFANLMLTLKSRWRSNAGMRRGGGRSLVGRLQRAVASLALGVGCGLGWDFIVVF